MELNFNIESWPWKIAVIVALLGMREFVRVLAPKDTKSEAGETSKWLIETIDSAAIAIGLVLFVIQPFILQAFYIPSGSMEDTLRISDRLLVSRMIYRLKDPEFQDVIVFKAPPAALVNQAGPKDVDFIKRCMGLPGDEIHVINRQVFRNKKAIPEPYTKWNESAPTSSLPVPDANAPDALATARYSYDMKIVGDAVYSREYNSPYEPDKPGEWTQNGIIVPESEQEAITEAPYGKIPKGHYLMFGDHRSNSNDSHVWGFVPRANIVGKAICVFWPPTRLGLVDKMSFHPRK